MLSLPKLAIGHLTVGVLFSVYGDDPRSPFYVGPMNHADTSCRSGDGRKPGQKPCTWYTHRTEQGTDASADTAL
eukprot:scaffold2131_cov384-Prasinococcus_capsulatus_cf.AAC.19